MFGHRYKQAAEQLKKLLKKKEKEGKDEGLKGPKHSPEYYAARMIQMTREFGKLDARTLANMVKEEGGAGEWGSDKLANKYKKDTPGQ